MLAQPTRSGLTPLWQPDREERDAALREVRARGWAMTDQQLALGIRSVAAPVRDGDDRVMAALNVNTHAAETSVEYLLDHHLPLLLRAAGDIGADFARLRTPAAQRRWHDRSGQAVRRAVTERRMTPWQARSTGLLVADFSRVLAGPYATMLLADMGADVVKVEGPPTGDETRSWSPPERDGVSTYYLGRQPRQALGRRSTCARRPTSRWPASWPRRADVMIQNFKPGGMAQFGLDFDVGARAPTPASSTPRSAASAPARARTCPATTCWCRRCRG